MLNLNNQDQEVIHDNLLLADLTNIKIVVANVLIAQVLVGVANLQLIVRVVKMVTISLEIHALHVKVLAIHALHQHLVTHV